MEAFVRYREYRIENLLEVKGLEIKKCFVTRYNEVEILGGVEKPKNCPHCEEGNLTDRRGKQKRIRHTEVCGKPSFIIYWHYNYRCSQCGLCYTPKASFNVYSENYSDAFVENVVTLARKMDLKGVSEYLKVAYGKIERIYYAYLCYWQSRAVSPIPWEATNIGIDEIAMKKGHKDFVLIIYDLNKGIVLDVLKDRKKKTLKRYLKSLPHATTSSIKSICIDMCYHYKDVILDLMPTVDIVIDRFHVSRELGKAVKDVRKELQEKGTFKSMTGKQRSMLHHAVNFSVEKLNKRPKYKKVLDIAFRLSKKLKRAVLLRREFKRIFDQRGHLAIPLLRQWIIKVEDSKLKPLIGFLKTYYNWRTWIESYIKVGYTNAAAEGLNNKIKMIKRMSFGYRSFSNFRLRILHTSGLLGYRLAQMQ